jgi:MFS family permease
VRRAALLAQPLRGLPPSVWVINGGLALSVFGSGMVTPFLVIYLHEVRELSLGAAGAAVGAMYAVALGSGLVAGRVVDRVGARTTTAVALVLAAGAFVLLGGVRDPWQAYVVLAVAGIGTGGYWPGYATLLAALAPPELRHNAYAVQRIAGNIALGLGALTGGLIASIADPATFTVLFLANACSYLVFALSLAFVPAGSAETERTPEHAGGYRDALRDRPFVAAIAINAGLGTAGIAQLNSTLPVFATREAGVSTAAVGAVFLCNTLTIVALQLPIARVLEGRSRMRALALVGGLSALAWLVALSANSAGLRLAAALLIFAGVVFALGECIQGVVQGPLVADLAPVRARGRYMALWLTSAQAAIALGAPVGAMLLEASPRALWLGAAAVCVAVAAAALALERVMPEHVRRTPHSAAHGLPQEAPSS